MGSNPVVRISSSEKKAFTSMPTIKGVSSSDQRTAPVADVSATIVQGENAVRVTRKWTFKSSERDQKENVLKILREKKRMTNGE